jgi:hypothetical protein
MYLKQIALLALPLAIATWPAAAQARIVCKNGFQVVRGELIATPYCQDALLARVAREYGMAASDARIRNNPNYKREVCRFVGHDIRISEHCLNEAGRAGGRGF